MTYQTRQDRNTMNGREALFASTIGLRHKAELAGLKRRYLYTIMRYIRNFKTQPAPEIRIQAMRISREIMPRAPLFIPEDSLTVGDSPSGSPCHTYLLVSIDSEQKA